MKRLWLIPNVMVYIHQSGIFWDQFRRCFVRPSGHEVLGGIGKAAPLQLTRFHTPTTYESGITTKAGGTPLALIILGLVEGRTALTYSNL